MMHPLVQRIVDEKARSGKTWAEFPVGRSTMSNWFLDKTSPTLENLEAMGECFGLELRWVEKQ